MGLIEMASGNSVWCGMDYYERKMVCSWKKSGEETYDGVVSGSEGNKYSVHIDKMHPRKSSCNCPFAEGRRIICKHMIALLFTAEPKAAKDFLRQVEEWEQEEKERERLHYKELSEYVNSLSKKNCKNVYMTHLWNWKTLETDIGKRWRKQFGVPRHPYRKSRKPKLPVFHIANIA